jgi:uncharacterized protein (DUF952 family)
LSSKNFMLNAFGRSFVVSLVYKIVDEALWFQAVASSVFSGAEIDQKDGFIHLSGGSQVQETARLHFSGRQNLLLVAFDPALLGESLKWEASRGGQLFPHVYGALATALAVWAKPLPWNGTSHDFPAGWNT